MNEAVRSSESSGDRWLIQRSGRQVSTANESELVHQLCQGTIWLTDQLVTPDGLVSVQNWFLAKRPTLKNHPLFTAGAAVVSGLPAVARRLSWGAFGWSVAWALIHRQWRLGLFWLLSLCLAFFTDLLSVNGGVPVVVFVNALFGFFVLLRGRGIAWQAKTWPSAEQFAKVQRRWDLTGIVVALVVWTPFAASLVAVAKYSDGRVKPQVADVTAALERANAESTTRNGVGAARWLLGAPAKADCTAKECRLLYTDRLWAPGDDSTAARPWMQVRLIAGPHPWFDTAFAQWRWDGHLITADPAEPQAIGHAMPANVCRTGGVEQGSLTLILKHGSWVLLGDPTGQNYRVRAFTYLATGTHELQAKLPVEIYVDDARGLQLNLYGEPVNLRRHPALDATPLHKLVLPLVPRCPEPGKD